MSPVSAPAQPCVSSFPARQLGNFVFAFVAADLVAATTTTSNTGVNIQQKMKILIKQSKELKRFKQFELLKQLKKLQQLQQLRQPQKLQQLEQSKQLKQLAPPPSWACVRVCACVTARRTASFALIVLIALVALIHLVALIALIALIVFYCFTCNCNN